MTLGRVKLVLHLVWVHHAHEKPFGHRAQIVLVRQAEHDLA
ncbi:MAG: hypothetical protein WDM76_07860 [Limisphaerales bacterium]